MSVTIQICLQGIFDNRINPPIRRQLIYAGRTFIFVENALSNHYGLLIAISAKFERDIFCICSQRVFACDEERDV